MTSFKSALEGCVFTLVEADQAKEGADLYEGMYLSYLNKLNACEDEIDARQKLSMNGRISLMNILQQEMRFKILLILKNILVKICIMSLSLINVKIHIVTRITFLTDLIMKNY